MIGASRPFSRRTLNALDENGNEGCAFLIKEDPQP